MKKTATYSFPLTPREKQVAAEIMAGSTNKEIADQLGISYETVKEHVQSILRKFGVERRELVAVRMLREQLTAESLGAEFVAKFDRMAESLEGLVGEMRSLVSVAVAQASNGKPKRKAGAN